MPLARRSSRERPPAASHAAKARLIAIVKNPQLAENLDMLLGFVSGPRVFRFKRPVEVVHQVEAGVHTHFSEELDILSYGQTWEESRQSFFALLESDWDDLAMSPDSKLMPYAKSKKKRLLKLVESVDGAK